jgi:hypothetical protein
MELFNVVLGRKKDLGKYRGKLIIKRQTDLSSLCTCSILSWDHVVVAPYGRSETSSVSFFFIHPSTSHLGRVDQHILYASLFFCCYSTLLQPFGINYSSLLNTAPNSEPLRNSNFAI